MKQFLSIFPLILLPFQSFAQPLDTISVMRAPDILVVTPLEEALLYGAPPGGFFNRKGALLGTVTTDQTYAVLGVQRQQSGIGNQDVWFRVAPLNADGTVIEAETGWVQFGSTRQPEISKLLVRSNSASPDGSGMMAIAISPQLFLEK